MKTELDVVRDVSQRLETAGFAYMLTGSMAMNYYAEPRMTRDIDLVVELLPKDVVTVIATFAPDYYVSRDAVADSIRNESMFNLIHEETILKVDCIVRKQAAYRRVEFARRARVTIGDFSTCIVSREDLILSKLVWAKDSRSELQFRDITNLLKDEVDAAYLEEWALELGVASLLAELRR